MRMKPVNIVLIATVIAILGTWSKKGQISTRMVIGGAVVAFIFVVAEDAPMTKQFAWLLLASTIGAYGDDLFTVIGDITTGGKTAERNTDKNVGNRVGTAIR